MNISIEMQNDLNNAFYEVNVQDISFSDSDIDNYYLEVSEISYDDNTNLQSISSTGLKEQENSITENQSVIINCKTICSYLIKPIASKLLKKISRKKPAAIKQIDKNRMQINELKSIDEKIYKIKLVKTNVQSACKSTNNYFTTCGDIVYYDI